MRGIEVTWNYGSSERTNELLERDENSDVICIEIEENIMSISPDEAYELITELRNRLDQLIR